MSAVDSPSHYRRGGIEIADAIDAFELPRWTDQAAQYLFRAHLKDGGAHEAQDLAKAMAFIIRRLSRISPATLDGVSAFGRALSPAVADGGPARYTPTAAGRLVPRMIDVGSIDLDVGGLSLRDAIDWLKPDEREGALDALNAARAGGPARPTDQLGFALAGADEGAEIVQALLRALPEAVAARRRVRTVARPS